MTTFEDEIKTLTKGKSSTELVNEVNRLYREFISEDDYPAYPPQAQAILLQRTTQTLLGEGEKPAPKKPELNSWPDIVLIAAASEATISQLDAILVFVDTSPKLADLWKLVEEEQNWVKQKY